MTAEQLEKVKDIPIRFRYKLRMHRSMSAYPAGAARRAIDRLDVAWIVGWLSGRFEIDVSAEWVASILRNRSLPTYNLDGPWSMWWKVRLEEIGSFPHGSKAYCGLILNELHVFFVGIEETEEHLEFLRNEGPLKDGLAVTSAISRTETMPLPINRVASRVVAKFATR
jgi:hypothetical protein